MKHCIYSNLTGHLPELESQDSKATVGSLGSGPPQSASGSATTHFALSVCAQASPWVSRRLSVALASPIVTEVSTNHSWPLHTPASGKAAAMVRLLGHTKHAHLGAHRGPQHASLETNRQTRGPADREGGRSFPNGWRTGGGPVLWLPATRGSSGTARFSS